MQKGKNGMRRVAALVCSVALFATLLPVQVLATDEGIQEPLTAVTLLNENGEETVSEQGDADNQQDEAVACTKNADCAAETHEEGCPKYVAPAEKEDTNPVVSCTKSEDCVAETHKEDCPKYVAPVEGEGTEPAVSCTKTPDCQADTHEEGCPKYEEKPSAPAVNGDKTGNTPAEPQEEKPEFMALQDNGTAGVENQADLEAAISSANGTAENPTVITITSDIELTTPISFTGKFVLLEGADSDVVISAGPDFDTTTSMFSVGSEEDVAGTLDNPISGLSLKNITIDLQSRGRAIVAKYAEINLLEGSLIQNGNFTSDGGAAIYLSNQAKLNMYSGACLSDNTSARNGGAVCIWPDGAFNMYGGTITRNSGNYGGAIWNSGGTIYIEGGTISENHQKEYGTIGSQDGSTCVIESKSQDDPVRIVDNTSDSWRCGVFGNAGSTLTIKGVLFQNNTIEAQTIAAGATVWAGKNSSGNGSCRIENNTFAGNTSPAINVGNGAIVGANVTDENQTLKFSGILYLSKAIPEGSILSVQQSVNTITDGTAVVKGTEGYTLTTSDLEKTNFRINTAATWALILDQANNQFVAKSGVKVTFNANTGGESQTSTQQVPLNQATALRANLFVREGYTFMGWNTNEDGTGTKYNNGAQVTFGTDITLYAQWIKTPTLTDSEIQMFTDTALRVAELPGATLSNLTTEDTDIVAISNLELTPKEVDQTATIAAVMTYNGYSFPVSFEVKTVPMNITFGTGKGENPGGIITYQYDGGQAPAFSQFATFYPAEISDGRVSPVEGSSAVTLVEGKDIVFNYDAGAGSNDYEYLPLNVTSEANPETGLPVTVKLLNENYCFVTASNVTPGAELRLSVVVTNDLTESAITGLGDATLSFTYDGTGKAAVTGLTDISADNISQFTLHFHGWGGTAFAEQHLTGDASVFTEEAVAKIAPKEPGSYLMIFTGVSENHYAYQSWIMTINKATVTITAADKTVITGDSDGLPPLTSEDYTVTGLVGNDKLTTPPTLDYEYGANVDTVGTYDIIPSGAAADEKYYTLQYVNGTLHVEKIAIIEGADQTWTQGSGNDLVIRSNADFSDFLRVEVNGNALVRDQDYTVRSGSTIVTIKAAYLDTLAAGDYTFAIVSKTGTASTHFTVKAKAAGESGASGNTGAATTTPAPSGSNVTYYTCPACGYHDWTATAEGYKCNHCGYVESAKQLSGYGNVKGVYEPKTSAAAAQSVSSSAIPQTGDVMPIGLMGGVTVIAAAAFVALFVLRKRQNND